ncbi:MAG: site-specific integrase [Brevundimonas sp.]|nr:site-specific integrase [Brevundimonas sp.]
MGEWIWDTAVAGFGARRHEGGSIRYVLRYRTRTGRRRLLTIGQHDAPWTPDTARDAALRFLVEVVAGGDPMARREIDVPVTISDLLDRYLADADAGRLLTRRRTAKAASTTATDRSRIDAHIRPILGGLTVAAVTRLDVERMMHDVIEGRTAKRTKLAKAHALSIVRGGRGAASRTVGLLGAVMTYAVRHGLRADNPVHGVVRPADGRRDRRLRVDEYAAIGAGLVAAEDDGVHGPGIEAIRFILLTGWRRGEVLGLRWSEVDLDRRTAQLTTTKTGASMRPLAMAACRIIRAMPRGEFVFAAPTGDVPMGGFPRIWSRVMHRVAGLPRDVTPHVLRHSYASLAADLGMADATIGVLLGHAGHTVTRRYIHCADAALLAAADAVAVETDRLMTPTA